MMPGHSDGGQLSAPATGQAARLRPPVHYPPGLMLDRVWVVIPTYNEAANVERIVRASAPSCSVRCPASTASWWSMTTPPTGREQSPTRSRKSSTRSRCCTARARTGLGHAYLAGFARALEGGAELVIEMDADFSHDPRYLR